LDKAILILWSETENNYLRGPTDLCREPDIISEIGKERLHKLGHGKNARRKNCDESAFKNIPEGRRSVAKP